MRVTIVEEDVEPKKKIFDILILYYTHKKLMLYNFQKFKITTLIRQV